LNFILGFRNCWKISGKGKLRKIRSSKKMKRRGTFCKYLTPSLLLKRSRVKKTMKKRLRMSWITLCLKKSSKLRKERSYLNQYLKSLPHESNLKEKSRILRLKRLTISTRRRRASKRCHYLL